MNFIDCFKKEMHEVSPNWRYNFIWKFVHDQTISVHDYIVFLKWRGFKKYTLLRNGNHLDESYRE